MRKSPARLEAEQIFNALIQDSTELEVLEKAKRYADQYKWAIAQKTTIAILFCTVWDFYEDFNEEMMKDLYNQYEAYFESFKNGNENIIEQMLEINKMLDGKLLKGKVFRVLHERTEHERS